MKRISPHLYSKIGDCQFGGIDINSSTVKLTVIKKLLIFSLVAFSSGCGVSGSRMTNVNRLLDSLRSVYAPDPRTALFSISPRAYGDSIALTGELDDLAVKQILLASLRNSGESRVIDSIDVLPDTSLGEKKFGIVKVSVGNLYSGPHDASELVDQVLMGYTVTVLKEHHGWYYVKSTPHPPYDNGYIGWIDTGDLFRVDSSELSVYDAQRRMLVTSILTTARVSPGSGETVSDLAMADLVRSLGASGSYIKVELPDGRTGYVSSSDLKYADVFYSTHEATPQGIEKYAKEFLGFPYLWGGTSSKAMDCSGFVKTVFRMNGIDLPRDASQQVEVGDTVNPGNDFDNLRSGDLLFFGDRASGGKESKIVHVGIYLENGYFIHSSSLVRISSLVPTDSLFDHYDYDRFVVAKRILKKIQ